MKAEITRNQLIDLLKSLVSERRTTNFYVRTDDNQLILIGISEGEIVSLWCGGKRGERAIPMIRNMRSGTYRMDDDMVVHHQFRTALPPSDTLLSLFSEADDSKADDFQWVQDVLCKVLAEYMGPIAPMVCRDTVNAAGGVDTASKVQKVVEDLSQEIDNAEEARRFRAQVQAELGSLLHP